MAIINNTWNIEHFQLKYKTKSQWETAGDNGADYVLAIGEVGLEIDTGKCKLGDGTKKWSELDYYSDPVLSGLISALTERITTAEGNITTLQSNVSTLQEKMTTAETDITALKSKVEAIEGITTISVNPAPAAGE